MRYLCVVKGDGDVMMALGFRFVLNLDFKLGQPPIYDLLPVFLGKRVKVGAVSGYANDEIGMLGWILMRFQDLLFRDHVQVDQRSALLIVGLDQGFQDLYAAAFLKKLLVYVKL